MRKFHVTSIFFLVKPDLRDRYFFNIETMGIVRHGLYRQPWPSWASSGETHLFPTSWAFRVRQQRGGGKQRGKGVYSAVLAAAARWQRWQSGGGSVAAAWRWKRKWYIRLWVWHTERKNKWKHPQHHVFWGECFSSSVPMYAFLCGNTTSIVFSNVVVLYYPVYDRVCRDVD